MKQALTELAGKEGFLSAFLPTEDIPVNGVFRTFCEENLCGKYNANYACPPDCGTPEALHKALLAEKEAFILLRIWPIDGYGDKSSIEHAKREHGKALLRLFHAMQALGFEGFAAGYNGCPLCEPCLRTKNLPCAHPGERIGCMSAYCIDITALAKRCELPFAWDETKLHLFALIAFHRKEG